MHGDIDSRFIQTEKESNVEDRHFDCKILAENALEMESIARAAEMVTAAERLSS